MISDLAFLHLTSDLTLLSFFCGALLVLVPFHKSLNILLLVIIVNYLSIENQFQQKCLVKSYKNVYPSDSKYEIYILLNPYNH